MRYVKKQINNNKENDRYQLRTHIDVRTGR